MSTTHPNKLLDYLIGNCGFKNDAHLSYVLDVSPAVISRIRHGSIRVKAPYILRIYDVTPLSIEEIRKLLEN